MEKMELHSILSEKMSACWNTYVDGLLTLPPIQIIGKAAEVTAARFCYDELTTNSASYPKRLLEHLLQYDDPLETMRERWMDEQRRIDHRGNLERVLRSLHSNKHSD